MMVFIEHKGNNPPFFTYLMWLLLRRQDKQVRNYTFLFLRLFSSNSNNNKKAAEIIFSNTNLLPADIHFRSYFKILTYVTSTTT